MPWNNDNEGGGQGPWGQGPKGNPRNQNNWGGGGNRGPGNNNLPPDLDELVRRGKDSLKGIIPGGGGGGGRGGWLVPLVLGAAFIVFNSLYQVQPDERGVVLRLGEYSRTVDPGLQFALWPIEKIEKPKVGSVQKISIGDNDAEGLMLTADKNIISVAFELQWQISDARAYLFNVADQQKAISAIAQTAMREVAAQTNAQTMLASDAVVTQQVTQTTQALLDRYETGVRVTSVNLGSVKPPQEVADAFADVVRAEQDRIKSENEAKLYRNQKTQEAEGQSSKLIEDANGIKTAIVSEATGEAARFISVYEQYKVAKDVTRQRMFLETMESVLSKSNKVIIESGPNGQGGVVPYLPLPQIQNQKVQ